MNRPATKILIREGEGENVDQLSYTQVLAFDRQGNVFVIEQPNYRFQIFCLFNDLINLLKVHSSILL